MILEKYTEQDFMREAPSEAGSAEILLSEQTSISPFNDSWDPSGSGSWPYLESMPSSSWNVELTGSISVGSIVGVKLNFKDTTQTNNKRSFQLCNSLAFTVTAGEQNRQTFLFDVIDRRIFNGYAYFKVSAPTNMMEGVKITFRRDSDTFEGYECNADSSGRPITFIVEPYFSLEESSVFNPLIGNVTGGVLSTFAKIVDSGTTHEYLWGHDDVWDDEFAASGETLDSGGQATGSRVVSRSADGEYAAWSGSDPVLTIDGGHFNMSTIPITVTPAEIPDYFYTAISSISGRFLGAKSGYEEKVSYLRVVDSSGSAQMEFVKDRDTLKEFVSRYIGNLTEGNERSLTRDTLDLVASHTASNPALINLIPSFSPDIDPEGPLNAPGREFKIVELGVDPAFFTAQEFQGSVYSVDAENIPDISEMVFEPVKFTTCTVYEIVSGSGTPGHVYYERTYNRPCDPVEVTDESGSVSYHAATLPVLGDVIYSSDLSKRYINSQIYVQDTKQVLTTDMFASVVSITDLSS